MRVVVEGIAHAQQVPEKFFAHCEFNPRAHAAPDDFNFIIQKIIRRVNCKECARRQNHLRRNAVRQKGVHDVANQHWREQSKSRAEERTDCHERECFFVRRVAFRKKFQLVLKHENPSLPSSVNKILHRFPAPSFLPTARKFFPVTTLKIFFLRR